MEYNILNRWSGEVQFTTEIDCKENELESIKLGLAVKWALKNNYDLSDANLRNADLRNADLWNANLRNADLWNADLWNANLWNADLRNADLRNANLRNADLWNADLRNADLWNADLRNADLRNANGDRKHIKTLNFFSEYTIAYTKSVLQIGCEKHGIKDWWGFDDKRILRMDGKKALKFWRKNKELIKTIIETNPAEGA